jgi:hypothetical protein
MDKPEAPPAKVRVRIKAKAQNAILAELVDRFGSVENAAKESGVPLSTYSSWLNFRTQPEFAGQQGMKVERRRKLILRLEELTGHSIYEIFPKLPKGVKAKLSKMQVYERELQLESLEDHRGIAFASA